MLLNFHEELKDNTKAQIILKDVLGRTQYQSSMRIQNNSISLKELNLKGKFFMQVTVAGKTYNKILVLE